MSAPAALCAEPQDRNRWLTVATFADMDQAKAHALHCLPDDTQSSEFAPQPLVFKWKRSGSDGKTRVYLKCASHLDCPFEVRCIRQNEGFLVQVLWPGIHSREECNSRVNAVCNKTQRELILKMANGGSKPGAIWSCLLSEHLQLCRRLGQEAEKRPGGGLVGAQKAARYFILFYLSLFDLF